jgi:hypothetical protein
VTCSKDESLALYGKHPLDVAHLFGVITVQGQDLPPSFRQHWRLPTLKVVIGSCNAIDRARAVGPYTWQLF